MARGRGVEKDLREKRKEKIREMHLACYSNEEIATILEVSETPVKSVLSDFQFQETKSPEVNFQDENFQTPIYNVWAFGKKTNEVSHPRARGMNIERSKFTLSTCLAPARAWNERI